MTLGRRALLLGGAAVLLGGCGGDGDAPPEAVPGTSPAPAPTPSPAPRSLPPDLGGLEDRFGARLGLYAIDTGSGRTLAHRDRERFAMCSTFKPLAAAAVLLAGRDDLAADCAAAVVRSDNPAANRLLAAIGGPPGVTRLARSLGDPVTRLDRTEPELNTVRPGDVRDTTTPAAIAGLYRALVLGDALPAADRARLTGWLTASTTGAQRIRAAVPDGWRLGHKTGTGAFGTANDIGVLWPPGAAPWVLAVMTDREALGAEPVEPLLAATAGAVVDAWR